MVQQQNQQQNQRQNQQQNQPQNQQQNHEQEHGKRQRAAHATFEDMLGQLRLETPDEKADPSVVDMATGADRLDGATFAKLLEVNFSKLDPTGHGITREELAQALMTPDLYSPDEFVMLHLLGKYFDTIANMVEDETGPQKVITSLDKDVLNQFLYHSKLTLSDLHKWRAILTSQPG